MLTSGESAADVGVFLVLFEFIYCYLLFIHFYAIGCRSVKAPQNLERERDIFFIFGSKTIIPQYMKGLRIFKDFCGGK